MPKNSYFTLIKSSVGFTFIPTVYGTNKLSLLYNIYFYLSKLFSIFSPGPIVAEIEINDSYEIVNTDYSTRYLIPSSEVETLAEKLMVGEEDILTPLYHVCDAKTSRDDIFSILKILVTIIPDRVRVLGFEPVMTYLCSLKADQLRRFFSEDTVDDAIAEMEYELSSDFDHSLKNNSEY